MDEVTTDNRRVNFKLSTFVAMIFGIVTSTFTVTTIYNTFLFMGNEITTNNIDAVERDEVTNGRLDKITKRIITRLEELEKDNSDTGK